MSFILCMMWSYGAFACPEKKLGFWRRVCWPFGLAGKIAEWVFEDDTK